MWLPTTTLKQRLSLITLVTAGIALLLAIATMFVMEATLFRNTIVSDISIKADIIGKQCSAALLFNVKKDAEETLESLRADPHIEYAAVYSRKGRLFASYQTESNEAWSPQLPLPNYVYRFGINHLDMLHPIILRGEQIGTVFIRSDLGSLRELLRSFLTAALVVLVVSLLVAYILVTRLQRTITGPVAELVGIMERVSREQDYTMRTTVQGPAELGALAQGFNDMLSTIQERDNELEQQRRHLEETVESLRTSTAELQEVNKKLEALDRLKSDFVSTVSHELRTPLTSIKAFVELILLKPEMSLDRQLRLLRTINEEGDRLGRLINDLLDLSKIEAGSVLWRSEDVSMKEVIQTSVDAILPLAQITGLQLSMATNDTLPHFLGDRDRLVQVMTNILSNAVKFTREGGAVTVRAHYEATPQPRIVVAVTDTGIGIPEKDLELIFDKFYRGGDQLTNKTQGTGLGLTIARQIVEHHGGALRATSAPGKGSTFTFTLPLAGKGLSIIAGDPPRSLST